MRKKYRIVKKYKGYVIECNHFKKLWSWSKFKFELVEQWFIADINGDPRIIDFVPCYDPLPVSSSEVEARSVLYELFEKLDFKDTVVFQAEIE